MTGRASLREPGIRDPRDGYTAAEMNAMVRGETTPAELCRRARGNTSAALTFTVYGTPQPAGSKTSGQRGDGTRFVRDSARRSAPWKREVAQAAGAAVNGAGLLDAALRLDVTFYVPRPKGHYGVRGLRPSAPVYPITRPDVTKLLRAVEDACTGVVWRDDSQVVVQSAAKRYGEPARCEIAVQVIE